MASSQIDPVPTVYPVARQPRLQFAARRSMPGARPSRRRIALTASSCTLPAADSPLVARSCCSRQSGRRALHGRGPTNREPDVEPVGRGRATTDGRLGFPHSLVYLGGPSSPRRYTCAPRGPLAQLGERRLCTAEVTGSRPVRSTNVFHAHEQAFWHSSGHVVNPPKRPRANARQTHPMSRGGVPYHWAPLDGIRHAGGPELREALPCALAPSGGSDSPRHLRAQRIYLPWPRRHRRAAEWGRRP
jgi:hypothetical protein